MKLVVVLILLVILLYVSYDEISNYDNMTSPEYKTQNAPLPAIKNEEIPHSMPYHPLEDHNPLIVQDPHMIQFNEKYIWLPEYIDAANKGEFIEISRKPGYRTKTNSSNQSWI